VKRGFGFWMKDGVYIAGEWYPAKGKAVWETDKKKVFPCVPVSSLKKAFSEVDFELGKEFDGETIPFGLWRYRVLSKLGFYEKKVKK